MRGGPSVSGGPSPANSIDLSQPLVLVLKQLEEGTQISAEELEEFVDELMSEVLEKPPEIRFEKSTEVVKSEVIERFGSKEAYMSLFPPSPEQFLQLLKGILDFLIDTVVDGVRGEDGDDLSSGLVFLSAIATIRDLIEAVDDEALPKADSAILASSTIALLARIFNEQKRDDNGDEVNWEAIIEDTLWASEKSNEVKGAESEQLARPPDDLSPKEGLQILRVDGAVVLYKRSDISIGRGAEMAQVSQDEFKEYLIANDVRPRFGPNSAEEFYSDPDL